MEKKPNFLKTFIFALTVLIIGSALFFSSFYLLQYVFNIVIHPALFFIIIIIEILVSVLIAYFLAKLLRSIVRAIVATSNNRSIADLLITGGGAIVGLIIALLLGISIQGLPLIGPYLNVAVSILFAYLGGFMAIRRKEEILSIFGQKKKKEDKSNDKFVDTSVLIDGRIVDIVKTGFVEGRLIIPDFVLDELQKIADSEDGLKRNRGRRGLDVIKKIQTEKGMPLEIMKTSDKDIGDILEVDSKLVRLATLERGLLLTNDFNLNKVAVVQGVHVLNINELANALKPVLLPGEDFYSRVIKKGKENNQGVAYLDDGTMIIIEEGENLVGQDVQLTVTSIMQTSAGRLIFAKVKGEES